MKRILWAFKVIVFMMIATITYADINTKLTTDVEVSYDAEVDLDQCIYKFFRSEVLNEICITKSASYHIVLLKQVLKNTEVGALQIYILESDVGGSPSEFTEFKTEEGITSFPLKFPNEKRGACLTTA
jgi:hypothetical protein